MPNDKKLEQQYSSDRAAANEISAQVDRLESGLAAQSGADIPGTMVTGVHGVPVPQADATERSMAIARELVRRETTNQLLNPVEATNQAALEPKQAELRAGPDREPLRDIIARTVHPGFTKAQGQEFGVLDFIPVTDVALAVDDLLAGVESEAAGTAAYSPGQKAALSLAVPLSILGAGSASKAVGKKLDKFLGEVDAVWSKAFPRKSVLDAEPAAEPGVVDKVKKAVTPRKKPGFELPPDQKTLVDVPMDPQSEEALQTLGEFQKWAGDDMGQYLEGKAAPNINLDNYGTTDDVRAAMEIMADNYNISQKTIPHADTVRAAEDLGMTPKELRKALDDGRVNSKTLYAGRMMLASSSKQLAEFSKAYDPTSLADRAKAWRMIQQHREIYDVTSGLTAEAGRALNSMRILAAESANDVARLSEELKVALGNNEASAIDDIMTSIGNAVDARHANQIVKDATKGNKWWNAGYELWVNGLLSGTGTLAVNVAGNTAFTAWQVPERAMAGLISGIRGAGHSADRIYVGEAMAQMYGAVEGFKDGMIAFGRAFKSGEASVGSATMKFENVTRSKNLSSEALELTGWLGRAADITGAVARTPTRLILSQDEMFKTVAMRMELNAQAYRQAVSESGGLGGNMQQVFRRVNELKSDPDQLSAPVFEQMNDFADYVTFQRELGETGRMVQGLVNTPWSKMEVPVGKFIIPFVRTPSNIFKTGVLERTPFALVSREYAAEIAKGGAAADVARSKLAAGTAIGVTAMSYVMSGHITGRGPIDPRQKAALMNSGWRPHSIKVEVGQNPDGSPIYEYKSYARIEPLSYILGATADLYDWAWYSQADDPLKDEQAAQIFAALTMTIAENSLDKNFMVNFADTLAVLNDPRRNLETWTERQTGSVIPGAINDLRKIEDPYIRETHGMLDALWNRTPGLSSELPPIRMWNGEAIRRDEGMWLGVASPIKTSKADASAVFNEIVRLGVNGVDVKSDSLMSNVTSAVNDAVGVDIGLGERRVFREALISAPGKVLMGGAVRLDDPYVYDRYILLSGQGVKLPALSDRRTKLSSEEWLNDMINTDMYKNAPDAVKASMINKSWEMFKNAGRAALQADPTPHPVTGQPIGEIVRNKMLDANVTRAELSGLDVTGLPEDVQQLINSIRSVK